jgi:hypothetical protein
VQGLVSRGLPARLLEAAGMFAATEERFSACVLAAVAGISAPTLGRCLGELGANLSCRVKGPPPVTVRALGGTGAAMRDDRGPAKLAVASPSYPSPQRALDSDTATSFTPGAAMPGCRALRPSRAATPARKLQGCVDA